MLHSHQLRPIGLASLLTICTPIAHATNGMNLEGYGPISTAMGGTGAAFDNGAAAVMNNPATLALSSSSQRLDVAVGMLGPNVNARYDEHGLEAGSDGDAYYMPAAGWFRQKEELTYGIGVFAQGGMGTDYSGHTFMGNPAQSPTSPKLQNRSELSVGRLLFPIAYQINSKLGIGATVDFVWAGLDLKMAMNEAQFGDLANPASQQAGTAAGSLVTAFGQMYEPMGGTGVSRLDYAYFDFSNDSDYTGEANGTGLGAKIGLTYKADSSLTIGAAYHSVTFLNDLESNDATLSMAVNIDTGVAMGGAPSGTYVDQTIPVSGSISIVDFQWPAMLVLGASKQINDQWQVAADIKRIQWSDVMENFTMKFTADNVATNGGFAGKTLEATLFQQWEDQDVIALGAAYQATGELTLRFGASLASNPIPNQFLNALFPAVIENHYTGGVSYLFTKQDSIHFSATYAPEVEFTSANEITSAHSQFNWQMMYSRLW